ncbi:hypothetical protein E1B28_007713 [Marasmius oreades]|uniref:Uncharacterized protein n=1 Tax=Marasmius oreades TaxID=181124 RepID=A0A9P7S2I0_9AGAR|nr:uncharacterized protein E1B28_007713 [Marasmius oreades]KAG7094095.1 hypothetical protein E1B28_007713 [Marasmius oreades]
MFRSWDCYIEDEVKVKITYTERRFFSLDGNVRNKLTGGEPLVLESLLYGAFCVLFVAAIWAIFSRRREVNYKLLTTMVTMWVLSTLHLVLDIVRAKAAFVDVGANGSNRALEYYGNLSDPLQAAKTAVYVTLTLVGDGFMIYRCYVVWGRWYMGLLPALMLCGTGVAGFGATYEFSQAAPGAEVFLPDIVPWVTSFIALTFSTNVLCTALIVIRILSVQRRVGGLNAKSPQINFSLRAIVIITESAALYSASVLSLLISYSVNSNGQYTVLDLTSPLIGIVFTFIILRATLVSDSDQVYASAPRANLPSASRYATGVGSEHYGMQPRGTPVAVNVTQLIETNDSLDHKMSNNTVV